MSSPNLRFTKVTIESASEIKSESLSKTANGVGDLVLEKDGIQALRRFIINYEDRNATTDSTLNTFPKFLHVVEHYPKKKKQKTIFQSVVQPHVKTTEITAVEP
jgi:hypothetical protein